METKVYVKPNNTGLLLNYQSHVGNRYKRSLSTTILYRAHRLSSSWTHFSDECDRLNIDFLKQVEEKKPQIMKQCDVTFYFTDASRL